MNEVSPDFKIGVTRAIFISLEMVTFEGKIKKAF